jgi:hypothetical protein
MAKTTTIIVTDDRYNNNHPVGVNGKVYRLQLNEEVNVNEETLEALRSSGVKFTEVKTNSNAPSAGEAAELETRPIITADEGAPGDGEALEPADANDAERGEYEARTEQPAPTQRKRSTK